MQDAQEMLEALIIETWIVRLLWIESGCVGVCTGVGSL
jgi:hypothetical protein